MDLTEIETFGRPKFNAFQYKEKTLLLKPEFKPEDKLNIVLYYVHWDNLNYLVYMYYSILSYLLFTDAKRIDIKVFTSEHSYQQASDMLGGIYKDLEIIPYRYKESDYYTDKHKYNFFNHPELQDYDLAVLSDCDLFCYSENGTLFSDLSKLSLGDTIANLKNRSIEDKGYWYGMQDFASALETRQKIAVDLMDSHHYFFNWIKRVLGYSQKEFEGFLDRSTWPMTGIMVYMPGHHFSGRGWKIYAEQASSIKVKDDETAAVCYTHKKGHKFKEIDGLIKDLSVKFAHKDEVKGGIGSLPTDGKQTYLIHPMLGLNFLDELYVEQNSKILADFFTLIESRVMDD